MIDRRRALDVYYYSAFAMKRASHDMKNRTALIAFAAVSGVLTLPGRTPAMDVPQAVVLSTGQAQTGAVPVQVATAPAPSQAAPQITFDHTVFDFGRVKQGEKPTHSFGFSNSGNWDLVIEKVRTTCGCTAAVASTGPYRPG